MQNFFFQKNTCLSTKINLRLKQNQKKTFKGNLEITLKIFCRRHQKNASYAFFIYGNCMISIFFDKKFFFFVLYDTPNFMPKQEKSFSKIRRHHFSKMYEICMTSIFS